ncbi:MAG: thioredoxin fold domain-containing protein [Planctomycetes bacterium]|nr:thioredoxin fold domain-containing protein [Planctomycetota bacterium]
MRQRLSALLVLALVASNVFAGGEGWSSDMKASMAKAAAEKKDMILDFTGSDWCIWCKRLNGEVFSQEAFKNSIPNEFVLVELDFPNDKSKLSAETQAQNKEWMEKFGVTGFPTIILTDASGKPYAKTGYQEGGPEKYVEHLHKLQGYKAKRDELLAAAEKAEGVEKAKQLDQLLGMSEEGLIVENEDQVMEQIVALDANNEAGLKAKYQIVAVQNKAGKALQSGPAGLDEAIKIIDDAFANLKPTGQSAQDLYLMRSQCLYYKKDKAGALKNLNDALEAAPQGDKVELIKNVKDRLFKD